jgi:hypothetical protein
MKATRLLFISVILFVLALALPGTALAADGPANPLPASPWSKVLPDEFVFGDNYTLENGDSLDGNLWVFGGNATLEEGSTVQGNVLVFGGNLVADGTIEGDISITGGSVMLGSTAVVQGDVNVTGGSLDRDSGARVDGSVQEDFRGPFRFNVPRGVRIPWMNVPMPYVDLHYPFWGVLEYFFRAFLVSAIAVLVAMFWPRQTAQTGQAILSQPLISGGMGLITVIVAPIVLVGLAITILLLPVSLLGFLLLGIMVVFGWIALGLEVGRRMAQSLFKTEWTLPVAAGLGTLVLTLIVDGIGQIWCVGWIFPALVGLVGLGGVLLTRFGTQPFTGGALSGVIPPVPPPASPAPVMPVQPVEREVVLVEEEPIPPAGGAVAYPVQESGEAYTVVRPVEPEPPLITPELPPDEETKA